MQPQIRSEALLQFKGGSYVSLREHTPEMGFHCAEANPQAVRNFLVAQAGCLKLSDLPLPCRQFVAHNYPFLTPLRCIRYTTYGAAGRAATGRQEKESLWPVGPSKAAAIGLGLYERENGKT